MFPSPRVVIIDDQLTHLTGLAKSLNRRGVASIHVLFTEDPARIPPCPDVRVIFADLHLGPGSLSTNPMTDFSTINSLLENEIKPVGPYFILLWTHYPDQAPALRTFLDERLKGVKKPFDVVPLAKADHLENGNVKDEDRLLAEIDSIAGGLPQIGALFDWESRVLRATGDTVSSLLELTSAEEADQRIAKLKRILATLGIEAVGETHVDDDRFRAVNEALLPILADRIADLRSAHGSNDIWARAFDTGDDARGLSVDDAAKLNRLVHVADPGNAGGAERGVVIPLPGRDDFRSVFDIEESDAASDQFRCKDFVPDDDRFRWVLVQCQAACDHAQSQPGPLPFHLGLDFPEENRSKGKQPSAAVWTSPPFEFNGTDRLLRVSARFPISLPSAKVRNERPVYRLREQLLNDLIHHLHTHGGRPGLISFSG